MNHQEHHDAVEKFFIDNMKTFPQALNTGSIAYFIYLILKCYQVNELEALKVLGKAASAYLSLADEETPKTH